MGAFSCCEDKPPCLNLFDLKTASLLPCSGFDVAGDGSSCPHTEGVCLKDEELVADECYKKCSLLDPDKPYRVSATICSKSNSVLSELNPLNDDASTKFAVGGGAGFDQEHKPIKTLTVNND